MRRRSFLGLLAALSLAPAWVKARFEEQDREAILLGALSDRFELFEDHVVPHELVELYTDSDRRVLGIAISSAERPGDLVMVDLRDGVGSGVAQLTASEPIEAGELVESGGDGRVRPQRDANGQAWWRTRS